jgi:ubiquinone/menaquinone biosynthesis C-methylase UbiE
MEQLQTSVAFGFKWKKRETYDSNAFKDFATKWYLKKYGFSSMDEWASRFSDHQRVLDIGCGSGFSSSLWLESIGWKGSASWVGIEISDAIDVAHERLDGIPNTHFVQADALKLPFQDNSFDAIYSEGVFHHTPSTKVALIEAARVLEPDGEIYFYIYRRKSPVREYTDDFVRGKLSHLTDEDAWDALRSLTMLGKVLSEAKVSVTLPESVPLLGIEKGTYDVQRLVYYHFAKLFWNGDLTYEENVHVNFDWYRPKYAHRHTAEEVREWCHESALAITRFFEDESGHTVVARKESAA